MPSHWWKIGNHTKIARFQFKVFYELSVTEISLLNNNKEQLLFICSEYAFGLSDWKNNVYVVRINGTRDLTI